MSIRNIRAALESALAAIPGIIPAVDITSSVNGEFTTDTEHGLSEGLHVTISGHSDASVNGTFKVADIVSDFKFSLETVLDETAIICNGTGGSVIAELIAWENMSFPTEANRVPYQKVNLIPGRPEDVTMGVGYRREYGVFQITLVYPLQIGTGDAEERAELIRSTFPRGASFSNGGVVVKIDMTPEIMPGYPTDDSYMIPVRVYYYADIFNS